MTSVIVETSPNDDREYRYLKLPNLLEVLLVHDLKTEKSAACCDVRIGSMADNVEAQGLAHFLGNLLTFSFIIKIFCYPILFLLY